MNGRTHALIGAAVVFPATLGSGISMAESSLLAAVCIGSSLGPDIDHPVSTVSRSLGKVFHDAAHGMSTAMRTGTSTSRDRWVFRQAKERGHDPSHRSLTHTLAFAVAVSGLVFFVSQSEIGASVVAASAVLASRCLFRGKEFRYLLPALGVAVLVLGPFILHDPSRVALASLAGWVSHLLGDACTTAGVPLFWPVKIKGRRWWRVRLLGSWLKSGERKEFVAAVGVSVVMNAPYLLSL